MSGCKLSSGVNWQGAMGVTAKTRKTGGHRIRTNCNDDTAVTLTVKIISHSCEEYMYV